MGKKIKIKPETGTVYQKKKVDLIITATKSTVSGSVSV